MQKGEGLAVVMGNVQISVPWSEREAQMGVEAADLEGMKGQRCLCRQRVLRRGASFQAVCHTEKESSSIIFATTWDTTDVSLLGLTLRVIMMGC